MALEFACPFCKVRIRVPEAAAGQRGRCPKCSQRITVPQPGPMPSPQPLPFDFPLTSPKQEPPPLAFDGIVVPELQTVGIEIDLFAGTESSAEATPRPGKGELPVDRSKPTPSPCEPPLAQQPTPRRFRRMWRAILIAIVVTAAAAGLLYWRLQQPALTGELTATVLSEPQLPKKFVVPTVDDLSAAEIAQVLQELRQSPRTLISTRAVVKLSADADRLEVSVVPGSQTTVYRVELTKDRALVKFLRQHRIEMEHARKADLLQAVNQLFRSLKASAIDRATDRDLTPFRDSVGFAASVQGAGYFLAAEHREQLWPCAYEDDQAVYFLLPRGLNQFELRGIPRPGTNTTFPGVFHIRVQR